MIELLAAVVAIQTFREEIRGKLVLLFIDSVEAALIKRPTPPFLISTLIWPIASGKPKVESACRLLPTARTTSSVGRL